MAGFLRLLTAIVFPVSCLMSQTEPFYVGSYTHGTPGGKGIYAGSINASDGSLGSVNLAAAATDPSFIEVPSGGKFLYAALESEGAVAAYAIRDGLTFLNQQPSMGKNPCFVSVNESGSRVFAANYGDAGVVCFPVRPDGYLDHPAISIGLAGSGPDKARQTAPHAHFIQVIGQFAYVCDLGTDKVHVFSLDPEQSLLAPLPRATAETPPGSGPRHLAVLPGGHFVYTVNEMKPGVTVFSRDAAGGALTPVQTVASPEHGKQHGDTGAEIACHPSGKWLYTSMRGADVLSLFAIGNDGKLTWVEDVPSLAKTPRSFAIDPSGKWLLTAGQADNRLVVFGIDPATGRLTPTGHEARVACPVCIAFVPR